jgi:hypothetical protein
MYSSDFQVPSSLQVTLPQTAGKNEIGTEGADM